MPLLWASYPEWESHQSQSNLDEGPRRRLKSRLPAYVRVIVPADRGFGRAELARACRQIGLHFLIRITPDAGVGHRRYRGLPRDYPVTEGIRRVLRGAAYRLEDPVARHVVTRWKRGLPPQRDEPWPLITDLPGGAAARAELYGRRMAAEELFRDGESLRHGWALRLTQLTKAGRFDRLLRVLALAYWPVVGLGLVGRQRYRPAAWCSSDRGQECSAFTIGRTLRQRLRLPPAAAVAAALAVVAANPKWG